MKFTFTHSFEKSIARRADKARAKGAVDSLMRSFEDRLKPKGLGLKKLHGDIWEIRAGLGTGILFAVLKGEIRFLLAGSHDEIKKFLKTVVGS